ncbi:putative s-adenosylmethionine-dependent methyltransferase-like protein [Golovinomyces cichoracearum]|uniref:Putative s-adenosylmethionine-dependent methyltransferase-like protein n=1 Tax=Golovinomyces cichoracearum TaxID=62708 RepID=A0A420II07_9PEZI|nr:putative s-adenosylmethionine-dependent methyltransferase-like protein [Golovinomyces cichoracearum]
MSLLNKHSSNRQQRPAVDKNASSLDQGLNSTHLEDSKTTPESKSSYDHQFQADSLRLRISVSRLNSVLYSWPNTLKALHSSVLSLDDFSKLQLQSQRSLRRLQSPPTEPKKTKGFFGRIRTSSGRPSASEAKPCPPSLPCSIMTKTTTATAMESPKPAWHAESPQIELELTYPRLLHQPPKHEITQLDLTALSENDNSTAAAQRPDLSHRHTDPQSDPHFLARNAAAEEPRHRPHLIRDSILHPFLKVSGRHYTHSHVDSYQHTRGTVKSDLHWHHSSRSASHIPFLLPPDQCLLDKNNSSNTSSQQQNLDHINSLSLPESQHMAPPTGSVTSRRIADTKVSIQPQQETRDNLSPSYNRNQFSTHQTSSSVPSPSIPPSQTQSYRATTQRDLYNNSQNEQGHNMSTVTTAERDINDNYKELVTKYKKVKGLYFEKTAQVEQLQNTLANQRLSQSRTSLDDSEYMTRFQRLEGAVTNLAFNIRKDWKTVPSWISQNVNHDAIKIGKQEMTAVGRAVITKILVDDIFDQIFHPGLPIELSRNLKVIEKNIRRLSPACSNREESEEITARIVQWRLTTLDGLKDVLASSESEENKKYFIQISTDKMTASLASFLQEPNPPGIENSARMIVELAVSIASNLPLESREISIVHPMPGSFFQSSIMKMENPIPTLLETAVESDDNGSTHSGEKDESCKDIKGQGNMQALMAGNSNVKNGEDGSQKVRFSGFVGIEVKERQVLCKAPVWTTF